MSNKAGAGAAAPSVTRVRDHGPANEGALKSDGRHGGCGWSLWNGLHDAGLARVVARFENRNGSTARPVSVFRLRVPSEPIGFKWEEAI